MRKTIYLFCLLALPATPVAFADVSVDHDKSADFSGYKTFTLEEGTPAVNPLMRQRLLEAIAGGLDAKGLEKVDEGGELRVVVHVSIEEEIRITDEGWTYGGHIGWRGWGGWGPTTVNVATVEVGTLMLDMVDVESDRLVWRGIASDSIPRKTAKQVKKIDKVIEKLFRNFPPKN